MTGPTHRQYSVCFGLIALMLSYKYGFTEVGYYLTIPIVLMASRFGAIFPDIDHDWQNVPDKTVVKRIINILIHATGGKHRSWQTHSADICAYFTIASYLIPKYLLSKGYLTLVNKEVLSLLLLGFCSGWISHLFSDMLNGVGIKLVCFSKLRIALVPKKLGKLRFNTGHEWEAFNFKIIKMINVVLGVITMIYPLILCGYISKLLEVVK